MTNPIQRLFGSLANALIDLGLPTIRAWFQERLGPGSDVQQITTDGSLVHLEQVRIPIGPRGQLVLDRASAAFTALGSAGLPQVRLHAFTGALSFADDLRAEVSFDALPEPPEAAWIYGELAIKNVVWSMRQGSPRGSPLQGGARLFVSSREWRLEKGRLDGAMVRAHFAASGAVEAEPTDPKPLVPANVHEARLMLEQARVGPFVDVAVAVSGRSIAIPSVVPLDARLDGGLAWSLRDGAKVDLAIASEVLDTSIRGVMKPDGTQIDVVVGVDLGLAALLRSIGAAREAMPRDEDFIEGEVVVKGSVGAPEVTAKLSAPEVGFRVGRPRFVPPVVLRNVAMEAFAKDGRAVLHGSAWAHQAPVTLDLDTTIADFKAARGTLAAPTIEAMFLRDVVRTLGAKIEIAAETTAAIEVTLGPDLTITGTLALATPSSKLVLAALPSGDLRLTGGITASDLLATGVFRGSVRPTAGELVLSLDVTRKPLSARGTAGAARVELAVANRELTFVLEGVSGNVAIDATHFRYSDVRFHGHGGTFNGRGVIPLANIDDALEPRIDVALEAGDEAFARAIVPLFTTRSLPLSIPALTAHGTLRLFGDGSLVVDLAARTQASDLVLGLRRDAAGALDGTTLRGRLSTKDVASLFPIDLAAVIDLDAHMRGHAMVLIAARAEELSVMQTYELTSVSLHAIVDERAVMWNRFEAHAYDGRLSSFGMRAHDTGLLRARVSVAALSVDELAPIIGQRVRGRLSGSVIAHVQNEHDVRASGHLTLADAAFPVLDLARPALARYGLRPPNEDAQAPVTATLVGDEFGLALRDIRLDLVGATLRAGVRVTRERQLHGEGEVTLEEEYLRTSKVLTLPRALTERLVIPVTLEGSFEHPKVHADLKKALGHLVSDNRVRTFLESAVEEAQILLGHHHIKEPTPASHHQAAAFDEQALETPLCEALDRRAPEWAELRER